MWVSFGKTVADVVVHFFLSQTVKRMHFFRMAFFDGSYADVVASLYIPYIKR